LKKLILFVILCIFLTSCTTENKINNLINESKSCNVDSDCVLIGSRCPFGCYQAININNSEEVKSAIYSYKSNCVYGCIECESVKCINNTCMT